jgi:hypothetical protein
MHTYTREISFLFFFFVIHDVSLESVYWDTDVHQGMMHNRLLLAIEKINRKSYIKRVIWCIYLWQITNNSLESISISIFLCIRSDFFFFLAKSVYKIRSPEHRRRIWRVSLVYLSRWKEQSVVSLPSGTWRERPKCLSVRACVCGSLMVRTNDYLCCLVCVYVAPIGANFSLSLSFAQVFIHHHHRLIVHL